MGKIIKHLKKINSRFNPLYSNSTRYESAECIHFHWRNLRIVMSKKEFLSVIKLNSASMDKWETIGRTAGCGDGHLLGEENIPKESEVTGNTIAIELNENCIHLHIRDIRLELKEDEFIELANCIEKGEKELLSYRNELPQG